MNRLPRSWALATGPRRWLRQDTLGSRFPPINTSTSRAQQLCGAYRHDGWSSCAPLSSLTGLAPASATTANSSITSSSSSNQPDAQGNPPISIISSATNATCLDAPSNASPPIGNLAIVFTDIVQSTMQWETFPTAMKEAMIIHDAFIRDEIVACGGYEVKLNGDGFMIAFSTAVSALSFCLAVQKRLIAVQWPQEILRSQWGKEVKDNVGTVVSRGLSVRMSIHWGVPVCKWNEITHRMDYLGPMVNRCARFIEVTQGGQIVVSQDYLAELDHAALRKHAEGEIVQDPVTQPAANTTNNNGAVTQLGHVRINSELVDVKEKLRDPNQHSLSGQDFEVRNIGKYELKGLLEPMELFFIVPSQLKGRFEDVEVD